MKTILIFAFIILLINPLFVVCAEEKIDPEKQYIVAGEQILRWQAHILSLQQYINNLTYALTEKDLEIVALQSEVEEWQSKYERSRKGLWTGIGSGWPLGAQGMAVYQFNERIGVFMIGGYSGLWAINVGFIARVK
ncbi:hypothetical protein LCGC14_1508970 [marine sediment metagenome]|uniref:Uncharacterized protein n=1 Tax=marine sediment metagenome TaxID=412755 RepID=A0A0F9JMQ3_9ZZZZ